MGTATKIEWCDHTFNPWRGCTKVAAGCAHCYAETQAKRNAKTLGIWGDHGTRVVASEAMWREPIKWNAAAVRDGVRRRVFCASMADVFEDWPGQLATSNGMHANTVYRNGKWQDRFAGVSLSGGTSAATLAHARRRLFHLIDETPQLDWLLLTKRPLNIEGMWPKRQQRDDEHYYCEEPAFNKDRGEWTEGIHRCRPWYRDNVWIGCSVSTQADADRDIPELLKCRDLAPVLFVSVEPLIERVDLTDWIRSPHLPDIDPGAHDLDWVIIGGESGTKARPCNLAWVRSPVRQCQAAGVPCFVKQLGSNIQCETKPLQVAVDDWMHVPEVLTTDPKGGDPEDWPEDLRVREFPR